MTQIYPTPLKIVVSDSWYEESCQQVTSCDYSNINEPNDIRIHISNGGLKPGSSGAPLYNIDRKVIGICSGVCIEAPPEDFCTLDFAHFGRFSLSWEGGGSIQTRLKDWLDPDDTQVETLDGIQLPNNQYGYQIYNSQTFNRNAYDLLRIGSHNSPTTAPFHVRSGGIVNLKAGREIQIRSCTKIDIGSTFHAYIEMPSCSDVVVLSGIDAHYTSDCGSSTPKINVETVNTFQEGLYASIYPNPVSDYLSIKTENMEAKIEIYSVLGILQIETKNTDKIDVSGLAPGLYFIRIGDKVSKFVKL